MKPSVSVSHRRQLVAAIVNSVAAPRVGLVTAAGFFALTSLLLTIDARRNPLATFDKPVIDAIQRVNLPFLMYGIDFVNAVTNSTWAVVFWGVVLLALIVERWWIPALAVLAMPWGGFANNMIGVYVVVRTRPDGDRLLRSVGDLDAPSFPSGHVMGAVMLYGFLLYLAPRMRYAMIRLTVVSVSLTILTLVGLARLWTGAHWPSDVLAAYAFGGLIVVLLVIAVEQLERTATVLSDLYRLPHGLPPFVLRLRLRA